MILENILFLIMAYIIVIIIYIGDTIILLNKLKNLKDGEEK